MTSPTLRHATLWTSIIAAIAIVGSYAFACVFPFAALATIAALTLPRTWGLLLVGAVWLANQAVGYALLGYPHTVDSVSWGVAIGAGAVAAFLAARAVAADRLAAPRAFAALAAGFVAYEALLFVVALAIGGTETFAPHIVLGIGLNDLGWFMLLAGLHRALALVQPARRLATAG